MPNPSGSSIPIQSLSVQLAGIVVVSLSPVPLGPRKRVHSWGSDGRNQHDQHGEKRKRTHAQKIAWAGTSVAGTTSACRSSEIWAGSWGGLSPYVLMLPDGARRRNNRVWIVLS